MKTKNVYRNIVPTIALLVCVFGRVHAQFVESSNPRTVSMGLTGVASSRGLDALDLNPANCSPADSNITVEFSLFPIGTSVGNNFFSYGTFQKYFSGIDTGKGNKIGTFVSENDKSSILQDIPNSGGKIGGGLSVTDFSLMVHTQHYGTLTFSVIERAGVSITLARDYVNLIFHGNPLGSIYNFNTTGFSGMWYREYGLTYAYTIPQLNIVKDFSLKDFSFGASIKLLHGFGAGIIDNNANASLGTDSAGIMHGIIKGRGRSSLTDFLYDKFNNKSDSSSSDSSSNGGNFSPFPAPAGVGFGFDLGVSARVLPFLQAGISITDIGSITWSRNVTEFTMNFDKSTPSDPTSQAQRDSITNALKGQRSVGQPFSLSLPTTLRIGCAAYLSQIPGLKSLPDGWIVEVQYTQGLVDVAGTSLQPLFSLGTEFHLLSWLPLRTGFAAGGDQPFRWSLGTGLTFHNFDLEIGTQDAQAMFATSSMRIISASFGMRVKI